MVFLITLWILQILHVVFVASQKLLHWISVIWEKVSRHYPIEVGEVVFTLLVWNTSEACSKFRDSMIAKNGSTPKKHEQIDTLFIVDSQIYEDSITVLAGPLFIWRVVWQPRI